MDQKEFLLERIGRERPDAVLIAGPTASGKSGLALAAAKQQAAAVVNCDSMQVYRELRIVTARPDDADLAVAPHHLYGHVAAATAYSAASYVADAAAVLRRLRRQGRPAVIVGGTGLYFRALEGGLSPMPEVDATVREKWRKLAATHPEQLHEQLARRDPAAAARLLPGDRQRLVRALEVVDSTGQSILQLQTQSSGRNLLSGMKLLRILIDPPRPLLRKRIEERFDRMLSSGALEEVAALVELDLPAALPAMRAIGVREIAAHLSGRISMDEARERAVVVTAQYAKRQSTWFRNQLSQEWIRCMG